LWRRTAFFTPAGPAGEGAKVLWLQTERLYADIRIPPDRPVRLEAEGFSHYDDEALVRLCAMQGFAGVLSVEADTCLWRRDLDLQPPGPIPDEARFALEGDTLTEYGLHAEYTEIWERQVDSQDPLAAFEGMEAGGGLLVVAGDHFIDVRPRREPLPPGADLAAIVRADLKAGRRDRAVDRLDMRISYGRVAGAGSAFTVVLSTHPWLEGRPLFPAGARFDPATGLLQAPGAPRRRLTGASGDQGRLLAMLATLN
jgi:hypothetical protein